MTRPSLLTDQQELRCFCARRPLLAMYGIREGKLFVHIKIYKQNRIFGESLHTQGVVKIHCRDCLRWHTVTIQAPNKAALQVDHDMTQESEASDG